MTTWDFMVSRKYWASNSFLQKGNSVIMVSLIYLFILSFNIGLMCCTFPGSISDIIIYVDSALAAA